jgi:hypothetical protein
MGMLARQGWRLVQEPDLLMGRVLRAKYFPGGSILDATVSPGISYTWRNILKGIELLKEGLVWRVGDGENIMAWDDPWIPACDTRKPRCLCGQSIITKVADLIKPVTSCWDEQLVQDHFDPADAKAILSINIWDGMEDNLAWHFDQKGFFFYQICLQAWGNAEGKSVRWLA